MTGAELQKKVRECFASTEMSVVFADDNLQFNIVEPEYGGIWASIYISSDGFVQLISKGNPFNLAEITAIQRGMRKLQRFHKHLRRKS